MGVPKTAQHGTHGGCNHSGLASLEHCTGTRLHIMCVVRLMTTGCHMLPPHPLRKTLIIAVFVCCLLCKVVRVAAQNTYLGANNASVSDNSVCLPKARPFSESSSSKATSVPQKTTLKAEARPLTAVLNPAPASSQTTQGVADRNNHEVEAGAINADVPSLDPLATKLDFDNTAQLPLQCRPEEEKKPNSSVKAFGAAQVQ